jgi:hypothetical protein
MALEKVEQLQQRYLPPDHLVQWIRTLPEKHWEIVGHSVQQRPIYAMRWGRGETRVFMWSQMHGNESTTTRALVDLIAYLLALDETHPWQSQFRFLLVPQLNPDGAAQFTRVNANKVDLNRDAQNRSQPESQVLRSLFDTLQPDFCFNLHDQRSIFGAGNSGKPAQVSFLAPAADQEKTKTEARKRAAQLVVTMHRALEPYIAGCIGRYNDQYNEHCVGDTFQGLNVPTVLIEAGHAEQDYQREECRTLIGIALLAALKAVSEKEILEDSNWPKTYDAIPENEKNFMDGLLIDGEKSIGYQFSEQLIQGQLHFIPERVASKQRPPYQHLVLRRGVDADEKRYTDLLRQLNKSVAE